MKYLKYSLFLLLISAGCSPKVFRESWIRDKAPEYFKARFETTSGNFEIEAYREWSPLAVDRLYQLIKRNYYTNTPLYRVIPNFVVQFGMADSAQEKRWARHKIPDEPVLQKNSKGTLSFAMDGKETRTTQLYINTRNNYRLDTLSYKSATGFPGVAVVTGGMDVVNKFYSYGEQPNNVTDTVKNASAYFKLHYPKMDYIKKAYVLK